MSPRIFATLLLLVMLSPTAWAESTLRCGSQIVSAGNPTAKLLAACGEPAFRDIWSIYPLAEGVIADEEEWYYNFGPNLLLRAIKLRSGQIAEINSEGYGFNDSPQPPCRPMDVVEGLSKYRLLLMCGEPLTRRVISEYQPYNGRYNGHRRNPGYFVQVFREEWVYNFGSGTLMRTAILENGRVTYVQQGDRGFN